jgi:hypothetical protein
MIQTRKNNSQPRMETRASRLQAVANRLALQVFIRLEAEIEAPNEERNVEQLNSIHPNLIQLEQHIQQQHLQQFNQQNLPHLYN